MTKNKCNKKGFTLIELLAIILIISLILGISGSYIISTINTSKEKSEKLAIANMKTTARIYIEENPNDVLWQIDEENTEKSYSCISIDTLINKGLLKKELKETYPTVKYIIVTKDNNNNFLSEKIDNTNTCSKNNNTVKIPTSTKYCNDLTYDSTTENQKLTKTPTDHFQFYDDLKKDAGTYKVTAKLEEGYIWQDGTKEDKTITCTIKKAFPMLVLDPNGEDNTNIEIGKDLTTKLTSNVDGKITIKPANKNYATAKTSDNNPNITATTPKEITITPLATRKINTTITITLTPTDTNNYYSSSINYTIGSPEKTKVPIPTSATYCKQNLFYNQTTQNLVNLAPNGYKFINTTATNIGSYTVTAKLQYGYIWQEDNSIEDKTIVCEIKRPTPLVTYDNQNGTGCTNKTVTYESEYGELCTPTRNGYKFTGWYTQASNGDNITSNTKVTNFNNHTLYAHWQENSGWGNNGTCKYYLENGIKVTGWKKIGNNWYYFAKADGKENKWQSAKEQGCMYTGWVYSEDYNCPTHGWYFDSNGIMLSNTTVNEYILDSSGCWRNYKKATTTDIWNIYKNPGYVFNVGFTKITYYPNSSTATTEIINQGTTRYNNTIASEYVGTIAKDKTVYVEVDSNNYPVTYTQLSNKYRTFIGIYVSNNNITINNNGCGLSSLPTQNINETTYYNVWIAAECKDNGVTCSKDQVSIKFQ